MLYSKAVDQPLQIVAPSIAFLSVFPAFFLSFSQVPFSHISFHHYGSVMARSLIQIVAAAPAVPGPSPAPTIPPHLALPISLPPYPQPRSSLPSSPPTNHHPPPPTYRYPPGPINYGPPPGPRYGMLTIFLIVLIGMVVMICAAARRRCNAEPPRDSYRDQHRVGTATPGAIATGRQPLTLQIATLVARATANQSGSVVPPSQSAPGLDADAIKTLPLLRYRKRSSAVEDDELPSGARIKGHGDCPVCLAEFYEGEPVRLLPFCLHLFHPLCIDQWLLVHPSCPICREAVQVVKEPSRGRYPEPPPL